MEDLDIEEFVDTVRRYRDSTGQEIYRQTLASDVWRKLGDITAQQTRDVVLVFLNKWLCRIPYDCDKKLARTLRAVSNPLLNFKKHSLQRVTWDCLLKDSDIIENIFRRIASVKAGRRTVGATATSKILHMFNPHFFVMSDEKIRDRYGCSDNEFGYVNFMWRMKLLGDALLQRYSLIRNLSADSALPNLASECKRSRETMLTKLIDEYNWVKYHP